MSQPAATKNNTSLDSAMEVYMRSRSQDNLCRVVEAGKRLVYHFAKIYAPEGRNEDLVQSGYEGLIKAAKRFNPDREVSFCTFAGHYIMGEMRHHIRREASFDRSRRVADLQHRINEVIDTYFKENGEIPTISYIAESVNVREEGVAEAMRAGWVPLEEVNLFKIQNIKHESFRLPIEDRIALEQAINKLTELQRKVIAMLFYRDMTQAQTAEKLGISQRKVSRVLHKSLQDMSEKLS